MNVGGRGPRSNNVLDFIERSPIAKTPEVRNASSTSTSHPPDVIHVIGVPRPSPLFVLFRFRVFKNPKNKKWGRPLNKATKNASHHHA